MTRENSWNLILEWIKSESLRKHSLCVEAALRAYARKYGQDLELWGVTGLMHDLDYERYPVPDPIAKTGHPFEAVKILREKGYPEEMIRAIMGHATYSGASRESLLAKVLFACDELCGFLMAMAHMRPERFQGITPDTVRKYLKKKKFAEKVSREEISQGITELGIPEEEHYLIVTKALQGIADQVGFE